jgi:hypothetical protein
MEKAFQGLPNLFVSALEPGKWVIKYIEAGGCRSGGEHYEIDKTILIGKGMGNYLGKFGVLKNPLPELMQDSAKYVQGKSLVDGYMAETYPDFNIEKTRYPRLGN